MKKTILFMAVVVAVATTACSSNENKTTEQTTISTDTTPTPPPPPPVPLAVYACSMHPEVTGQKGEKCPKCGKELTEVAKNNATTDTSRRAN